MQLQLVSTAAVQTTEETPMTDLQTAVPLTGACTPPGALHACCPATSHEECGCPVCHNGPCSECGATNLQNMFDGLCGPCNRRRRAAAGPSQHVEACENHPDRAAFRNPGTRRNEFFCTECHKAAGEPLALTSSVQNLVADCKTYDIDDPRHEDIHVRGNRFRCVRCHRDTFDAGKRKQMMADR